MYGLSARSKFSKKALSIAVLVGRGGDGCHLAPCSVLALHGFCKAAVACFWQDEQVFLCRSPQRGQKGVQPCA